MNRLNHHRTTVFAAGLITAGVLVNVASATHSWGGYGSHNPKIHLKLGDNLSTDWRAHLAKASADWNNPSSIYIRTSVVAGQAKKRCSMVQGTTQVCDAAYGNNGWLGLATIDIAGGVHITQGSAKMNNSYFDLSTYNNPNEKQHVMCQEVAHTFGLDDQSEDGTSLNTCMDYFSNTGANATSTQGTETLALFGTTAHARQS